MVKLVKFVKLDAIYFNQRILKKLTNEQTLVIESGHPLGLFHSPTNAPRVIITNGLMVGVKDNLEDFKRFAALGVANYGQMTAGGLMYIGPQGIVHGYLFNITKCCKKTKSPKY
jgi:urocanate hydratase